MLFGLLALFAAHAAHAALTDFEVVNAEPQLRATPSNFSAYLAFWRKGAGEGTLVSRRELAWSVRDCATREELRSDGETYWYLDTETLPVASRTGYFYGVLANFNGLHVRGVGPFVSPARVPGEGSSAHRQRVGRAYDAWAAKASPRGTYGELEIRAEYRFYPRASGLRLGEFEPFSRWSADSSHASDRWPVYFDERAHKSHTVLEPTIWSDGEVFEPDEFQFRIRWDGCVGEGQDIRVTFEGAPLPLPGPNRSGR